MPEATEKDKITHHQWALKCSHGSCMTPQHKDSSQISHYPALSPFRKPTAAPFAAWPQLRVLRGRWALVSLPFLHDNIHRNQTMRSSLVFEKHLQLSHGESWAWQKNGLIQEKWQCPVCPHGVQMAFPLPRVRTEGRSLQNKIISFSKGLYLSNLVTLGEIP